MYKFEFWMILYLNKDNHYACISKIINLPFIPNYDLGLKINRIGFHVKKDFSNTIPYYDTRKKIFIMELELSEDIGSVDSGLDSFEIRSKKILEHLIKNKWKLRFYSHHFK